MGCGFPWRAVSSLGATSDSAFALAFDRPGSSGATR